MTHSESYFEGRIALLPAAFGLTAATFAPLWWPCPDTFIHKHTHFPIKTPATPRLISPSASTRLRFCRFLYTFRFVSESCLPSPVTRSPQQHRRDACCIPPPLSLFSLFRHHPPLNVSFERLTRVLFVNFHPLQTLHRRLYQLLATNLAFSLTVCVCVFYSVLVHGGGGCWTGGVS